MEKIDFRTLEGHKALGSEKLDHRWWRLSGKDMAKSILETVATIKKADAKRYEQAEINARLYGDVSLLSMIAGPSGPRNVGKQTNRERVSFNLIQSGIDTVQSKIAKEKPRPMFVTQGGNSKQRAKAKNLEKFNDGIYYENGVTQLAPIILRDAAVIHDGMVKVSEENGRVKFTRTMATELHVDPLECFFGDPRQLHQERPVDRSLAMQMWPDFAKEIAQAEPAPLGSGTLQSMSISDLVTVIESWRLQSGPDAGDGLHTIIIGDIVILRDDKWQRNNFPFAKLPWSKRLHGYWSQSAAEQLQNLQLEINKLCWVIQRSMHMSGTRLIFVDTNSRMADEQWTNNLGTFQKYNGSGSPPIIATPPIVQPEIYQHLETLWNKGFQILGVSQLSAGGQKPLGLDSKVALREMVDIESDRFSVVANAYSQFHLDLSKLAIQEAKDIFQRDGKFAVKVPGKKFLDSVDWADIDMDDDEYTLQQYPVSSLPKDPAGKFQAVTERVQAGFLSPRSARRLLDFPDLLAEEDKANAMEDFLNKVIDEMLDTGKLYTPEPGFDDLAMAKEIAHQAYTYGKLQGDPESRLNVLRQFLSLIDKTSADLAAAQAVPADPSQAGAMGPGAAPPPAGQPQALPLPMPQSDLIKNVPGGV